MARDKAKRASRQTSLQIPSAINDNKKYMIGIIQFK